jgi:hypothetical protein
MTALYTYRINGYYLKFDLYNNEEFEELALWVVLNKPSIPEIAKKIQKLADKYRASGVDEWGEKIRAWLDS